ncbi:MAG: ATP-binding protein [Acidimicrobiales bacterium]|nr:ATP-binding protein [Acidimicrobiales bacterium]
MSAETVAALAAAVLGALWVVTLLWWWRSRRRFRAEAHNAAARLSESPIAEVRGLEATMRQLEAAVDDAVAKGGDASAAETRMAHALSVIDDGIVLLDDNGSIVFRNRPAETFLDARHGEAIVESTIEELAATALEGQDGSRTLELFGPPRRTLVLTADPLDDGYRSIGALVVIEDVTERQRVDAVRRDFVANISHELKTPVGGIGVLAETLLTEDDLGIIGRLAERMHHEAMRASRTIDDLLELSRIEAGEASLRDPVPVHLVLAEAVERATTAAEHRGITIDLVEPSRRLELLGDRRQLVSAVFNLLDNAIKYSSDGSSVVVSAATDGPSVQLWVADRGIGIPRRDLERIFERFYRVDRARSRETGGTGLGLAIVRHVASNHGGEVRVDSREGEGTTFTLVMPAGPGPVAVSTQEAG